MASDVLVQPLEESRRKLSDKTPIGSILKSREWENVPLALRERAFFSAGVESIRFLSDAQRGIQDILTLAKEQTRGGEALVDRSSLIARLREVAIQEGIPVDPRKAGRIQDITSRQRLALIVDTNLAMAREYARWKAEQDPDILDAFPAQELLRIEDRAVPRKWRERWTQAGGQLVGGGRMIAKKNDPIWSRINRFGVPWPPFDFNSGMGLEDIDRETAESLGVLDPDEVVPPAEVDFNAGLEASVRGLTDREKAQLQAFFGRQVDVSGDVVRWRGQALPPMPPTVPPAPPGPPVVPPAPPVPVVPPAPPVPVAPPAQPTPAPSLQPEVSKAAKLSFKTKKDGARFKKVFDTIDGLHKDGLLSEIPINNKIAKGSNGTYFATSSQAISIGVRKTKLTDAEFSLVHEVGHWLDHIGIPSPGYKFASEANMPLFQKFWDEVRKTSSYADLDNIGDFDYRQYAKQGREVWARAYAQYVAVRTGSPELVSRLNEIRQWNQGYPKGMQWEDAEFGPIADAIDEMFKTLGWMQ